MDWLKPESHGLPWGGDGDQNKTGDLLEGKEKEVHAGQAAPQCLLVTCPCQHI